MSKNFPQFQEAQRMPIKINAKTKTKKATTNYLRRNIFKEQGQQCKTVIDVVDTNPTISVITLNINGLNTPIKNRFCKKKKLSVDQKT